ncbi:HEPN domain-containing protein [Mycobacteroides abscessus]|uniref:HEPN domain-containing protein n=1 Tax=Mycobacteroides abscessus TaxID=36809 RepID=UPI0009B0ACF3|nr:HEPN domain-containing protein [Mycobacteroides abscessus]SLL18429.1 Uncharacterised protein [Mycobacteroides abscessus subsp. abscessus]
MASSARRTFDLNCDDINRLLAIHRDISGDARGRKYGVEVLNKAAVVLLTAFWEAYCEDVAAEGLSLIVSHAPDAASLSVELRKLIAKELKGAPHDLAVWDLAGDGWRNVLSNRLEALSEKRNRTLNTPKTGNIDELFKDTLGMVAISSSWYWPGMSIGQASSKLDQYVTLRGAIAHRGRADLSVTKAQVRDYYSHVKRLVGKTGGAVNRVVKTATGQGLW